MICNGMLICEPLNACNILFVVLATDEKQNKNLACYKWDKMQKLFEFTASNVSEEAIPNWLGPVCLFFAIVIVAFMIFITYHDSENTNKRMIKKIESIRNSSRVVDANEFLLLYPFYGEYVMTHAAFGGGEVFVTNRIDHTTRVLYSEEDAFIFVYNYLNGYLFCVFDLSSVDGEDIRIKIKLNDNRNDS